MNPNQKYQCPYCGNTIPTPSYPVTAMNESMDAGPAPYIFNLEEATEQNTTFRTSLWTGTHLQLTVMNLNPGEEIGAEMHDDLDQFIRIEEGTGVAVFGYTEETMNSRTPVYSNDAIIVPAGIWHNLINTGRESLKLYSVYAPPAHPWNTVHRTKAESDAAEDY